MTQQISKLSPPARMQLEGRKLVRALVTQHADPAIADGTQGKERDAIRRLVVEIKKTLGLPLIIAHITQNMNTLDKFLKGELVNKHAYTPKIFFDLAQYYAHSQKPPGTPFNVSAEETIAAFNKLYDGERIKAPAGHNFAGAASEAGDVTSTSNANGHGKGTPRKPKPPRRPDLSNCPPDLVKYEAGGGDIKALMADLPKSYRDVPYDRVIDFIKNGGPARLGNNGGFSRVAMVIVELNNMVREKKPRDNHRIGFDAIFEKSKKKPVADMDLDND